MAQQATLRAWCDRAGSRRVALPDLSHLVHHEQDGPRRVLGLELEWLTTGRQHRHGRRPRRGRRSARARRWSSCRCATPAACCRRGTSWSSCPRPRASATYACTPTGPGSGSRCPYWDRSLAEVAALFDSVYVSLYKGLGGSSGALVVCPEDLAGELRSWRQRMGGTLFSLTAPAVGGLIGLREHLRPVRRLPRVGRRARGGPARAGVPDVPRASRTSARSWPTPPARPTRSTSGSSPSSRSAGVVACGLWRDADVPGWVETELTCYESAIRHDPAEVAG